MLTNQRLDAEASLMIAVKLRFLQSRRSLTEDKAGSLFERALANPTALLLQRLILVNASGSALLNSSCLASKS